MGSIRIAVPEDAETLAGIYGPYVRDTAISFETTPPSTEEFSRRIAATYPKYPYLVYEDNGEILGYAYANPYHQREAYRYSVSSSVYLRPEATGRGLGKVLYRALFDILRAQGFRNVYALITIPNPRSIALHEAFAFRIAGTTKRCGYKFGKWIDVAIMEMFLIEDEDTGDPKPIVPVPEVDPVILKRIQEYRD